MQMLPLRPTFLDYPDSIFGKLQSITQYLGMLLYISHMKTQYMTYDKFTLRS